MLKQVIVMRRDLKVRTGKLIVQGCHASIGAYKKVSQASIEKWEEDGCTKICVYVPDESALLELHVTVAILNLPVYLVQDAGRTEFHGTPTYTCLAIGPAPSEIIDKVTGTLPLL